MVLKRAEENTKNMLVGMGGATQPLAKLCHWPTGAKSLAQAQW